MNGARESLETQRRRRHAGRALDHWLKAEDLWEHDQEDMLEHIQRDVESY